MGKVFVDPGICGLKTTITSESIDDFVTLTIESECPHINKLGGKIEDIDPLTELFAKPADTEIYKAVAPVLAHTACPLYSALYKAVEVAAAMALPRDVTMKIEP